MKKLLLLLCAVGLLSLSALAQNSPSYAGTWKLDKDKSKMDQRMMVDSMTWTVSQTGKDLKIVSEVKRLEAPMMPAPAGGPPAVAPPAGGQPMGSGGGRGMGGGGGRGMGRGGFGMGGDGTLVYTLDGKEVVGEVDGPMGKMPITYKGVVGADGSIVLTSARSFNGPNGEIKLTTKETWKMSADGKVLTVERENSTPRGAQTSTLVFNKG